MSTVATVLNGIRYDLRNYGDIDFDEQQLIHNLNRSIATLDYFLMTTNSDWTLNSGDVTLSSAANYTAVPTGAINIREVWIGDERKEQLSPMSLYYKREFRTDTAEPQFWAHVADNLQFDVTADADYTVTVYYDKQSTALTSSTETMPYSGRFDNFLINATVVLCEAKKYKNPQEADALYMAIFQNITYQDMVNRRFVKKNYRLDF